MATNFWSLLVCEAEKGDELSLSLEKNFRCIHQIKYYDFRNNHFELLTFTEDYDSLPWYKKAGQWICGIEKHDDDQPKMSPEEQEAFEKKQLSIHETKWSSRILNVNAIVLMTLAVFLWGFYA